MKNHTKTLESTRLDSQLDENGNNSIAFFINVYLVYIKRNEKSRKIKYKKCMKTDLKLTESIN